MSAPAMDHGAASRVIDGRELEPPEPLVLTLDALETLGPHDRLRLLLNREPLPLYQALQAGGYAWQSRRCADDSFEILIWRTGG